MTRRRNDWVQLAAEFEISGLTQSEFANSRGVKLTSSRNGYYSVRSGKKANRKDRAVRFVPVRIGGVPPSDPSRVFEVRVGQLSFRFEVGTDVRYIVSLLTQLSSAC